jgi:hypothetical protein
MNKSIHIQTTKESSLAEQLVQSTVLGLRQLEQVLGYEFEETIDTIQKLHELNQRKEYRLDDGTVITDPRAFMDDETLEAYAREAL